jgi:hypothetical protein
MVPFLAVLRHLARKYRPRLAAHSHNRALDMGWLISQNTLLRSSGYSAMTLDIWNFFKKPDLQPLGRLNITSSKVIR